LSKRETGVLKQQTPIQYPPNLLMLPPATVRRRDLPGIELSSDGVEACMMSFRSWQGPGQSIPATVLVPPAMTTAK